MARDTTESAAPEQLKPGTRIAAVVSTYHGELTGAMRDAAAKELLAAGLASENFLVVEAPGAFELPVIARRLALREDIDAVLCFALILKGETQHDEVIAHATASALQDLALTTGRPILFGVLTCATIEQARERALGSEKNKGREVARAAIAVLDALDRAATVGERRDSMGFQSRSTEAQR